MTVTLVRLDGVDAATSAAARTIYEGGFAEHLRAPWAEVSHDVRDDETALVALDTAGEAVGFALVRDSQGLLFLRYLVIDARRRGQGLGSATWVGLTEYARGRGFALLVWDVEHPAEDGASADARHLRRRRVGFYERLGGSVLPVEDYTNPHEDEHGAHEVPMLLMAAPLDTAPLPLDDCTWVDHVVAEVNRTRWHR